MDRGAPTSTAPSSISITAIVSRVVQAMDRIQTTAQEQTTEPVPIATLGMSLIARASAHRRAGLGTATVTMDRGAPTSIVLTLMPILVTATTDWQAAGPTMAAALQTMAGAMIPVVPSAKYWIAPVCV